MKNQIITFTDNAASHIKKMIEKKANAIGFRLSVKVAGCTGFKYQPEIAEQHLNDDQQFMAVQGFPVFIDSESIEFIKGTEIDYVTKGISQQLVFHNPNAENECGCGESFHVKEKVDE